MVLVTHSTATSAMASLPMPLNADQCSEESFEAPAVQGKLRVLLRRAYTIKAANRHGSSNPFVVVHCGGTHAASRVINHSLDPAWNQEFNFEGSLEAFVESGLELRIFHKHKEMYSRDQPLGSVRVSLHWLRRYEYKDYAEPTSSQGTLHFDVEWMPQRGDDKEHTSSHTPSMAALRDIGAVSQDLHDAASGLQKPAAIFIAGFERAAKTHFAEWAEARVARGMEKVYGRSVEYLHNKSEVPSFVAATVVTVWDTLWAEIREPVSEYLQEEFGKAIGVVSVATTDPDKRNKTPADGARAMSHVPNETCCTRCWDAPGRALRELRVHWVRTRYPYDKSSWRTMANKWWWLHTVASMFPYWGVAPIYWVLTFAFIERSDEYQLCQFIVQFKGLIAFTTGLIGILSGSLKVALASDALIGCVAEHTQGGIETCSLPLGWPGGYSTFRWELVCWCIEVLTVWVAFVLLPFSSDRAVELRKVVRRRAAAAEAERAANTRTGRLSARPRPDTPSSGPPSPDTRGYDSPSPDPLSNARDHLASRESIEALDATPAHERRAMLRKSIRDTHRCRPADVGGGGGRTCRFSTAAAAAAAHSGRSLNAHADDDDAEDRSRPTEPKAPLEWALAAADAADRRRSLASVGAAPDLEGPPSPGGVSDVGSAGSQADSSDVGGVGTSSFCCGMRHNIRRGGLLRRWFAYELSISAVCAALAASEFLRLILRVSPAPTTALCGPWTPCAHDAGAIDAAISAIRALCARLLEGYALLGPLEDYQMRAALFWCRVLYGLLSLPFFLFTLPLVFEALTHSRPTGYDAEGACVRQLSARERARKLKVEEREQAKASADRLSARYHGGSSHGSTRPGADADAGALTPIASPMASSLEMV